MPRKECVRLSHLVYALMSMTKYSFKDDSKFDPQTFRD